MEPFWSHTPSLYIGAVQAQNRSSIAVAPYFEHAGITLYHGDCREILPRFSPKRSTWCSRTPYLVSYSGRWGSDWCIIEGDSDAAWVEPVFAKLFRLLKPDSLCLTFYGWPHLEI